MGALYLTFALWVARPLIACLNCGIPFGTTPNTQAAIDFRACDSQQLFFFFWLFANNISQGRFPFANPYEFASFNPSGLHSMGPWGFPLQPFFALFQVFGQEAAYNLLVLFSFPINGLALVFMLRKMGPHLRF